MFKKQTPKTPVRLAKKEEEKKYQFNEKIINIGIALGVFLLFLIFLLISIRICPPTYGFFWW